MEILNIGPLELLIFLIIAFILLGPRDMVLTAYKIGQFIRSIVRSPIWQEIMGYSRDIRDLPTKLMDETGLREELNSVQETTKDAMKEVNTSLREVSKAAEVPEASHLRIQPTGSSTQPAVPAPVPAVAHAASETLPSVEPPAEVVTVTEPEAQAAVTGARIYDEPSAEVETPEQVSGVRIYDAPETVTAEAEAEPIAADDFAAAVEAEVEPAGADQIAAQPAPESPVSETAEPAAAVDVVEPVAVSELEPAQTDPAVLEVASSDEETPDEPSLPALSAVDLTESVSAHPNGNGKVHDAATPDASLSTPDVSTPDVAASAPAPAAEAEAGEAKPAPRKRGRPRKTEAAQPAVNGNGEAAAQASVEEAAPKPARKPRKPRVKAQESASQEAPAESVEPDLGEPHLPDSATGTA